MQSTATCGPRTAGQRGDTAGLALCTRGEVYEKRGMLELDWTCVWFSSCKWCSNMHEIVVFVVLPVKTKKPFPASDISSVYCVASHCPQSAGVTQQIGSLDDATLALGGPKLR